MAGVDEKVIWLVEDNLKDEHLSLLTLEKSVVTVVPRSRAGG